MNLKDIIGKLQEADRAEAEKTITEAIAAGNPLAGVTTQEHAAKFIDENRLFKSAHDADISRKIAAHDEKFMAESFPKLAKVEADKREQEVMLRLKPDLDPVKALEIAMKKQADDFAATLAERDKKEVLGNQRALAMKIAASEGIPVDDIERFIGDDDIKTTESVKAYAARVKAFRDAGVESALKERLGNNGAPRGGNIAQPTDLQSQYDAAIKAGNADLALAIQSKMQAVTE
jgi:hypothetical protein